jgi:glycosyltransferase involved in cell wall biosynthesis
MPAWNAAPFIGRAVQSVLVQSRRDIELLIVDDSSTDATFEICTQIAYRDPRVRIFRQAARRGVSAARNRALEEARGRWLALLDADDWYHPERLERLLAWAEALGADMIADNLFFVRDGRSKPYQKLRRCTRGPPRRITLLEFLRNDRPRMRAAGFGLLQPMLRQSFIAARGLRYDEGLPFGEDFVFAVAALAKGARFFFVPQPFYFYRRHPASVTHNFDAAEGAERAGRAAAVILTPAHPDCVAMLARRERLIRRHRRYREIATALRSGNLLRGIVLALARPTLAPLLTARAARALVLRLCGSWVHET